MLLIAMFALLAVSPGDSVTPPSNQNMFPPSHQDDLVPVPLCLALENIGYGDEIPIILSGVYFPDYLDDPGDRCRLQVTDSTCVEFAPGVVVPPEFEEILEDYFSHGVLGVFRGVLHGPPHPRSVELAPEDSYFVKMLDRWVAGSCPLYCEHQYRTKFVVEEILSFGPVPEDLTRSDGNTIIEDPPMPVSMELPEYPIQAVGARYEGAVILVVTVEDGGVTKVEVQFGDPFVVHEAFTNVQTWRFASDVNTRFAIKYDFRLERRAIGEDANPAYEMRLPSYIRVIGSRKRW